MIKLVVTDEPIIARSASLFWWKRIYVGKLYWMLAYSLQNAAIHHERAHCDKHHMEWRILFLLMPWWFTWLCERQELAADSYAASCGYKDAMRYLLAYHSNPIKGRYHPDLDTRLDNLARYSLNTNPAQLGVT